MTSKTFALQYCQYIKRSICFMLGIACFYGAQARAEESAQQNTQNAHLHYSAFVHGYHAVDIDVDYILQPWGYGMQTHLYTIGFASWFITLNLLSNVQGRFSQDDVVPVAFDNQGFSRGEQRHAHIEFDLSGPHVTTLTPPENKREPLPQTEYHQSIDMLSYLVALSHRLDTKHDCTSAKPIFDGVHLSYLEMHGPTQDNIPKDHHPIFTGKALRCDFTGRQIGGFSIGSQYKAAQAAPHPGTVWLVHDSKVGTIPVRIEFTHPKMGAILVVLQKSPQLTSLPMNSAD